MDIYTRSWSFNGLVFTWLQGGDDETLRRILMLVGGAVTLAALLRHTEPARVWSAAGAAFVLLSPTVHPWYALWAVVPSLLCARWGWSVAGVALLVGSRG